MSDATEEPSTPTSAQPELRTVSDEELRCILEKHKQWLAAEDRTGLDHLQADLSLVDLRGQGACLIGAQLQGAKLMGARLQGVYFHNVQLQGANLTRVQLQRADLYGTPLQGATLSAAQLQEANLTGTQLQGAKLNGAQLQGAYLTRAHFREAILINANLERLAVTEDGEPGQQRSADLTDADFRDADLSNAQLSTVNGLRAEMLAGAVLTNAKLPEDVARFDQLKHVEETSRNASTVFFGLLAASLYSWLTIATTTDVALITGTASSPLPIMNTNIALSGFYLAAPLILLAVYFYFHLYLQRLWSDLASLPAVFPDGVPLDRKAYPWLLNGLVRKHFKKLELAQRPLTRVENVVSILLAWWIVPLTLLAFWLRFLPRHDWWVGTPLHVILIALAAGFGMYSYRLAVRTLSGGATATEEDKKNSQPFCVRIWRTARRYLPTGMAAASAGLTIVMVLSAGAAIDPGNDLLTTLGYETSADLTDDDVSTKPSGWTGRDETADVEIAQVKGADLDGRDLRNANARGAFLMKAKLAEAKLAEANLSGADLTDANLHLANLTGADLSDANLTDANLHRANLSGAQLHGTNLSGADLSRANLTDASLRLVRDHRRGMVRHLIANLSGANLTHANLSGANLRGACGDDMTQLPEGLTIERCSIAAPLTSPKPPAGSSSGPQPR
jgi:uncharacterized protein YjbI with pentapeptide repeats